MKFQFRLQSVLTIRFHQRDEQRRRLAVAKKIHEQRLAEFHDLASSRLAVMDELRSMNNNESCFSADLMIERQRYADQLGKALAKKEAEIEETGRELEQSYRELVAADQAVRSLEKLAERQRAEFDFKKEACFSRDLADAIRFKR